MSSIRQSAQESVSGCHGCRHFAVTYDPSWPYQCQLFGLLSKRLPSIEVFEASGEPCQAREARGGDDRRRSEPRPGEQAPGGGLYA